MHGVPHHCIVPMLQSGQAFTKGTVFSKEAREATEKTKQKATTRRPHSPTYTCSVHAWQCSQPGYSDLFARMPREQVQAPWQPLARWHRCISSKMDSSLAQTSSCKPLSTQQSWTRKRITPTDPAGAWGRPLRRVSQAFPQEGTSCFLTDQQSGGPI